jgi:hypothetical protein
MELSSDFHIFKDLDLLAYWISCVYVKVGQI